MEDLPCGSTVVILAVWILGSVLAGNIAERKGLRRMTYVLLSLLLSPIVGLLAAAVASPNTAAVEGQRIAAGERKCPWCAELVKREAKVCRFCSKDLPEPEPSPGASKFKTREEYEAWKAKEQKP